MGNCVPVLKAGDSASKLNCSSYSGAECILIERHIQENAAGFAVTRLSSFQEPGGKEDRNFCPESPDPRIESDCEDFFSVNGDLTPIHQNSPTLAETPELDQSLCVEKQLRELFQESFSEENGDPLVGHQDLHPGSDAESSIFDLQQNAANISPYETMADIVFRSVTIPNANSNPRARKVAQFAQCCLPKLVRSLSCSERKRR